ncbi:MAG TPA: hypothetical protein PLK58_10110, partial [Candidatus Rifleibacterium sp.]|nr:hypothetical protein [Candidatus Rifleibacterium sp.]
NLPDFFNGQVFTVKFNHFLVFLYISGVLSCLPAECCSYGRQVIAWHGQFFSHTVQPMQFLALAGSTVPLTVRRNTPPGQSLTQRQH